MISSPMLKNHHRIVRHLMLFVMPVHERNTNINNSISKVSYCRFHRSLFRSDDMRDVIYLLVQMLTTLAKLLRPGAGRTVIAENLILKQSLIIHRRSRQRAPNLSTQNHYPVFGFWSLFLNPQRIARSAIIIKLSTLLRFHTAMKKRKSRLGYLAGRC